jgi:ribonuclease BN (tRNA processing enzyme)
VSTLDLSFVGTGNAFVPNGICWNGFVANRTYLFEAPPQALMSLNRLGIDPNEIEAVILSHHHGDHFLGLPFLLLHWKHKGRKKPVRIIGPANTQAVARLVSEAVYPGVFEQTYGIDWTEAEPGRSLQVGGLTLESVPVLHDPKINQSLGFKCALGGRKFAYTGDSAMCDAVLDLARHSEVLVSECASRADRIPVHMNLVDDMPLVRSALAPEATLLMTHIDIGVDTGGMQRTIVAKDFESYRF